MAFPSRTFVDFQGNIPAEWLNAVNQFCVTGGSNQFSQLYVDNISELTAAHGVIISGITLKGGAINFGSSGINSNGLFGTTVQLANSGGAEPTYLTADVSVAGTATLRPSYSAGTPNLKLDATGDITLQAGTITVPSNTTFTGSTPPISNATPTLPGHLTNHQYVEEHLTLITGILSGCEYSVVMGGTTFSITAGTARVVQSNYPSPETHMDYTVPAFTNVTDNYPTSGLTVVGIQLVSGVASLVQQNTDFTDAQRLTIAPICIIAKSAGVIIAAASLVVPSYASGRLAMDLYRALGPVCTGLSYAGNTGQTLRRTTGSLFRVGGNYLTSKTLPNTVTLAAQQPVQFASYSRNGSNTVFSNSGILTSFDPSKYDDGGASTNGIPTGTVSPNRWQAVRIWVSSNGYSLLQYGTTTYNTSDEAINGVTSENFYAAPITSQLPFRGLLIVRGGATDFTSASDAIILNAGKLGDSSSASAGSAIGNVQIQFKYGGTNLGTTGTVDTVDFVGAGVTASRAGNTLTVSIPKVAFDNKIINGCFRVNQRGVTGTVTLSAGQYGHDRWKAGASGCTYTFTTSENVTTITITSGTLVQVIEGINLLSGTHTLQWVGTATARIDSGSYGVSGIQGTATGGVNQSIEFSTGTLSRVQYVSGTTLPLFSLRNISDELEYCKRYYQKSTGIGDYSSWQGYMANATSNRNSSVYFSSEMRVAPTVVLVGKTNGGPVSSSTGVVTSAAGGFKEQRSGTGTGDAFWTSEWTATAEL